MNILFRAIRPILIASFLSFSFGCAVKPVSTAQDVNRLTIKLNKYENNAYALIGTKSGRIAWDHGRNRELSFVYPKNTRFDQCFSIKDRKGVTLGELDSFMLDLPDKHRRLTRELALVDRQIESAGSAQQRQSRLVSRSQSALRSSPAYQGGSCTLPRQQKIPLKPKVPCKSRDQCVTEATAICYTIMFQAEGCNLAAQRHGVSGLLASPACTLTATELAGRKYGLDDAILDVMQGGVDDFAKELLKNEDLFSRFIGGLTLVSNLAVKAGRAEACHREIVNTQYDLPLRAWENQVQLIKQGPRRSQKHCERSIRDLSQAKVAAIKYGQELIEKSAKRREVAALLAKVKRGTKEIAPCETQQ